MMHPIQRQGLEAVTKNVMTSLITLPTAKQNQMLYFHSELAQGFQRKEKNKGKSAIFGYAHLA